MASTAPLPGGGAGPPALGALLDFLGERSLRIKALEQEAIAALQEKKDQNAHRRLMTERSQLIAALDTDSLPLITAFNAASGPESSTARLAEEAARRLNRFARGGRNALRLDSIFYMSALLYPDEHRPGEPDNLERLIQELAASGV
ncbi:hypothetical protein LJC59_02155 [Desulfovibrio sp. OttesenSCG-928-A18]|nr:hypothetical protein [Desulfovibrio sp. OttesenSCG-928-A18]